ncbi:hypothetical protein FJZ31_35915 [Candidatus Poribacteria bacterium]|nr:hypothetical protein [Candidatus Poribacteria bacterium]
MNDVMKVRTYTPPEEEIASDDYFISVNGKPVFVYRARVSAVPFNQVWPGYQRPLEQTELASFAYWDMAGPVMIEVTSERPVKSVVIRPTSYGIQPSVENDKIIFQMLRPGQVTVEVNGTHHALHLFANPLEDTVPNPDNPDVLYFGPGVHHAGKIELKSGKTVYIAGSAVVYGAIVAAEASNIKILGRGILDTSTFNRGDVGGSISLYGCTHVEIDGIIIRDPNAWTVTPAACQHVAISNIKLIGLWRYNTDGIDIVNSQDVNIETCFVRSFDDSIVIKGLKGRREHPTGDMPVRDVTVSDCVIWNDWGRALEIGAETVAPEISALVFKNCDIIRTTHIAMDIQHGDRAMVQDIRFENIRFEIDDNSPRPRMQSAHNEKYPVEENDKYCPRLLCLCLVLINTFTVNAGYEHKAQSVLEIKKTHYSRDEERGRIRDVHIKDVVVTGKHFPASYFCGYDATHQVENITIENLRINGELITNAEKGRFSIKDYVSNVRFVVEGSY